MLFFYIRHGDPTYNPDELTPLGRRQAEAVAKRLSLYGIDRIFASTSNRAIQTAQPACEILKKEMTLLDFANENHAYRDFSIVKESGERIWAIEERKTQRLFASSAMRELGESWHTHPDLPACNFKGGIERIRQESYRFLESLGYRHIPDSGTYQVIQPNNERIALFAHHNFGIAFLSCILNIPYPVFCSHFSMCHSGMTVINFAEDEDGYTTPVILTLSSDSHLYREGLPTKYNNELFFWGNF